MHNGLAIGSNGDFSNLGANTAETFLHRYAQGTTFGQVSAIPCSFRCDLQNLLMSRMFVKEFHTELKGIGSRAMGQFINE